MLKKKGIHTVSFGPILLSFYTKSGDRRVNEQVAMSALHALWHRYHNTIENRLHRLNPHWSGTKLFQETRRITGAIWQHIVYNEYVPTVVGPKEMEKYRLTLATKGYIDRKCR